MNRTIGAADGPGPNRLSVPGDLLLALLAVLLTAAIVVPMSTWGMVDFNHEAVLFKPAVDLANGKMLFRDSFTQYGPFGVLLQYLAVSLFGAYMIVVKVQMALLYALAGGFLYLAWRVFLPAWLAFLCVLIWNLLSYHFLHTFLAWASGYALAFQSIAFFFLLRFSIDRAAWALWIAGIAAGATMLCKQNVGVYLIAAGFVGILWLAIISDRSVRTAVTSCLTFAAGIACAVVPLVLWLAAKGAIDGWVLQNYVWPAQWAEDYGGFSLPRIVQLLTVSRFFGTDAYNSPWAHPGWIFVILPFSALGLGILLAVRSFRGKASRLDDTMIVACLVGGASWLQYYPINGIGHVWWASTPLVGITAYVARALANAPWPDRFAPHERARPVVLAVLLALVFMAPVVHRIGHFVRTFDEQRQRYVRVDFENPLKNMWIDEKLAAHARAVDRELKKLTPDNPNVVTFGDRGYYLTFVPDNDFDHPLWSLTTNELLKIYPDTVDAYRAYIGSRQPIVIVSGSFREPFLPLLDGYRKVVEIPNPDTDILSIWVPDSAPASAGDQPT